MICTPGTHQGLAAKCGAVQRTMTVKCYCVMVGARYFFETLIPNNILRQPGAGSDARL
jgi:hypothetical protein